MEAVHGVRQWGLCFVCGESCISCPESAGLAWPDVWRFTREKGNLDFLNVNVTFLICVVLGWPWSDLLNIQPE